MWHRIENIKLIEGKKYDVMDFQRFNAKAIYTNGKFILKNGKEIKAARIYA